MSELKMIIHEIKGIHHAVIDIPIENGVYAIVGNNGTGKSTIVSCLAQLISRHNLGALRKEDHNADSYVEFYANARHDHWHCGEDNFWVSDTFPNTIRFNGTYEGSLFYGARFKDSRNVDELMESGQIVDSDIVDADEYIRTNLGSILHNQPDYYHGLKRIRNKSIAERLNLKNTPYFLDINGNLISQYRMSSGECLLISLLHFIYNSLIRRSLPTNKPILMLIDEIELALHPIAVSNLIDLLKELTDEFENLTVLLTSHSPEVIRKISPINIFKIELVDDPKNNFNIVNPCYPSYAIRDVYTHDGFDYLLLVEDELAKLIVKNAIQALDLNSSRLINVLPVGGWFNVLKLQYELIENNVLGVGTEIVSILDGDVKGNIPKQYRHLKKFFLPISSVEKYLREVLVEKPNLVIKKKINDRFFTICSIDSILNEYNKHEHELSTQLGDEYKADTDGKRLYNKLLQYLSSKKVTPDMFIDGLYEIIQTNVDFSQFNTNLKEQLTAQ